MESLFVPKLFSQLLYNPLCTILLEDPTEPPNEGTSLKVSQYFVSQQIISPCLLQISVEFTNNEAVVASAVYSNNLDLCSWSSLNEPFFNRSLAYRWKFVNYRYM